MAYQSLMGHHAHTQRGNLAIANPTTGTFFQRKPENPEETQVTQDRNSRLRIKPGTVKWLGGNATTLYPKIHTLICIS